MQSKNTGGWMKMIGDSSGSKRGGSRRSAFMFQLSRGTDGFSQTVMPIDTAPMRKQARIVGCAGIPNSGIERRPVSCLSRQVRRMRCFLLVSAGNPSFMEQRDDGLLDGRTRRQKSYVEPFRSDLWLLSGLCTNLGESIRASNTKR